MDNIIPTNISYSRLRQVKKQGYLLQKSFGGLVFFVSCYLLIISLTHVRAALNQVPVDFAVATINNKQRLDDEPLRHFIDLTRVSIKLNDTSHYWADLTTLLLYQAQKQGIFNKTGINTLKQAKQSAEYALAQAPANAYLWYQLATINLLLGESNEKTAKILLMSILTGPSEAGYLIPRLNLCLTIFSTFTRDERDILRIQVLNAWTLSHKSFLDICAYNKEQMTLISLLLQDKNPDVLNEILSDFEKTH